MPVVGTLFVVLVAQSYNISATLLSLFLRLFTSRRQMVAQKHANYFVKACRLRCKSICFCSGWLRDGCVVSDGKRKKRANENLQSNKERRFGGKKMKPFSQGKQVWLRSVSPLRRATTSLFYHPGFCGSSYPRLL